MASYLVTGGAGFIGSHIVHALEGQGHQVSVLDDFSTGRHKNLASLISRITVVEGSICDLTALDRAMADSEYCVHLAAIPSVPRSVDNPAASNDTNVTGTLNVLLAAREHGVKRIVLASSSSIYGNAVNMPLDEEVPRVPISPYGVTKACNEMYAEAFNALYGMEIVSLRYFNVFGPRQDPNSQYAAVIPIFLERMARNKAPLIFGDGLQARDFTYVDNVVHANLAACNCAKPLRGIFNIACGASTTLLSLVDKMNKVLGTALAPEFAPPRPGDIRQSWAKIDRARTAFGFQPQVDLTEGLRRTVQWMRETENQP